MAWDPIRKWIHRRPLMLFAACLVSGMAIGYQNAVSWPVWAAVLALFAALGLLRKHIAFLFAAALPLGALMVTLALIKPVVAEQDDVLLTGRLVSEPVVTETYTRFLLDNVTADGEPLPTRVMAYLHESDLPPLEYGMTVSFEADTYLPADRNNPYPDTYEAYMWQLGAALCASSWNADLTILAPPAFYIAGWSIRCRLRLQEVVDSLYPADVAPLVTALALGDRSTLPDELYANFKLAGLAHLLAISGLHISCLAVFLDWLLRKARCPSKLTVILVTLFLVFYAALVGFPASICRAVLMYVLSAAARLLGRPSDGLTGLSLALMILLFINPLSIADVSLILSFSSVAGLMIFTRLLTPRSVFRISGSLRQPVIWTITALAASLAAQLGALPTVACIFDYFSTYSLLANLPALPLLTLSLPAAMTSIAVGLIAPAFGKFIASLVEWPLRLLTGISSRIASLPGAAIDTPLWPAALILLYAAVCVLISPVSAIRRKFKQLLICLLPSIAAMALFLPHTFPTTGLEVLFLDAGHADAAIIRAEDTYYLMDVGEDGVMADHLSDSGIRPAGIFLSHPHSDHAGGLDEILELCPPSVLYLPCLWNETDADEGVPELIPSAAENGWVIKRLEAGDVLRLSDHVSARVVQPFSDMTEDGNGSSLCLLVSLGEGSVLFTGDLTIEAEYAFFPDCDVLKIPHHGAKSSTSSLLLQMTTPSAAIISAGHNSYGHPSEEVLARLAAVGAEVFRTDECGAISALLGPDGLSSITPMTKPEALP